MNLAALIDAHPDRAVALVSRGRTTTYGELRAQVASLRGGLRSLGLVPGDRVAVAGANNWFFPVAYLASLGVGAVVVPMNPSGAGPELQEQLAATGARVAVVSPSAVEAFATIDRAAVRLEHVLVPSGVDLAGAEDLEALFDKAPAPAVERADDDLAVLMFTAGTAGPPKAAKLTHGNLRSNLEQVQAEPGLALNADDVALGVLPLFHIFGLNVVLGLALHAGASVVLVERFDPVTTLEDVGAHGVTVLAGAPPVFVAWSSLPGVDPGALGSVRLAVSGGAPLASETAGAFEARFGMPLWQGYGLTEASPIVTSTVVGGEPRRGSIGLPLPGVEVRLVDEEGEAALAGDPGELWVRGPNVFGGYWDGDEATAAVLSPDGWLRTGDVGVADHDGYIYLVDRAKDLIIVSGFNVWPAEVEAVLERCPDVAAAAAVGVPHPSSGEAVRAYVVAAPGCHLEEDQIIGFCARHLSRYKCPTAVSFVESLPQGLVGKVLRRALRASGA